ncbi:hypothetical protein [Pleurocapsa sp. FMAR1]|nr:hypothetical protein [Pleurocapsa sp. FMAR1]
MRISYKFGQASINQILGMENKGDCMTEQLTKVEIEKDESVRKLL